jgi:hypothetical protein
MIFTLVLVSYQQNLLQASLSVLTQFIFKQSMAGIVAACMLRGHEVQEESIYVAEVCSIHEYIVLTLHLSFTSIAAGIFVEHKTSKFVITQLCASVLQSHCT